MKFLVIWKLELSLLSSHVAAAVARPRGARYQARLEPADIAASRVFGTGP